MLKIRSAHTGVGAVAVSVALCTMLFATCLSAAELPAREKACCAAMQHDCDGMAMSSCCVAPAVPEHAVVPSKPAEPQPLVVVIIATPTPVVDQPVIRQHLPVAANVTASPPGVQTYLFVSSFRI
jgi:hypothetical protein